MSDKPQPLRVVEPFASDPMSVPELQSHGNALLVQAAGAARIALRASTELDFLYETRTYKLRDIERMQRQAHDARAKWQEVAGLLDEIVHQAKIFGTSR